MMWDSCVYAFKEWNNNGSGGPSGGGLVYVGCCKDEIIMTFFGG
jgi:hypothetical protein